MTKQRGGLTLVVAAACFLALGSIAGCSMFKGDSERQPGQSRNSEAGVGGGERQGGFHLFGGDRQYGETQAPAQIGVNAFLWRASLDTLSFMPLSSADPFGGVIITDWYQSTSTPNERFKATVYILDTRLRADALNVSIFRQTQSGGVWADAAVDPDTEVQIENAILRRARQLRLSTLGNSR